MKKMIYSVMVVLVILAGAPLLPVQAAGWTPPARCPTFQQGNGSIYQFCMPAPGSWNGDLVVFAHGYVSPFDPLGLAWEESQLTLSDGTFVPDLINSLGYAFVTSSYPVNGLAIKQGVPDMVNLVDQFNGWSSNEPTAFKPAGAAVHVYLVGASEGGAVTTLAVERFPKKFSGGLELCGPVGDFRGQINYWEDFRVLYDYYLKQVPIPFSPVNIDPTVNAFWTTPIPTPPFNGLTYEEAIVGNATAHPAELVQLIKVSKAPIDPAVPQTALATLDGLLWYNVFSTNDGIAKLGGQPYSNIGRRYGFPYDPVLNAGVERIPPDASTPKALAEIAAYYQPSGKLVKPLVSMHNIGDPIIPYWQTTLYRVRTLAKGSTLNYINIPINSYGHCNFNTSQLLLAFSLLTYRVTHQFSLTTQSMVPADQMKEFTGMAQKYKLPAQ